MTITESDSYFYTTLICETDVTICVTSENLPTGNSTVDSSLLNKFTSLKCRYILLKSRESVKHSVNVFSTNVSENAHNFILYTRT